MDAFPMYDFQAKCPKCSHKDVGTQYVKRGGHYGEPCESGPRKLAESEHIHRHCRRCGYEWCEACLSDQLTVEPPNPPVNEIERLLQIEAIAKELVEREIKYRHFLDWSPEHKLLMRMAAFLGV